jgi:replicative DNA helicase
MKRWKLEWPWKDLNDAIGEIVGGLMYVVCARPGNGKTTFLLSLAEHLIRTKINVTYWGTECTPVQLRQLIAAPHCGLSYFDYIRGLGTADQRGTVETLCARLERNPHIRFPSGTPQSADEILGELLREKNDTGFVPQVIVLDHIHRVSQEKAVLDAVVKGFREACNQGVAVILAAQLNRMGVGKLSRCTPPEMWQLKSTGAIEEEPDIVTGVYRPIRKGVSDDVMKEVLKGERPYTDIIKPDVMAQWVMKHRPEGKREGRIVEYAVRDNRIFSYVPESAHNFIDSPSSDRYTSDGDIIA